MDSSETPMIDTSWTQYSVLVVDDEPGMLSFLQRALGLLGNIIWFIFAGIWLAIGHVVSAVACFVTIIGIPFALQHLKLAGIALAPIGKTIVSKEVAEAARTANAATVVAAARDKN